MTTWEYQWYFVGAAGVRESSGFEIGSTEGANRWSEELGKLGSAGWELVSVAPLGGFSVEIAPIDVDISDGTGIGFGGGGKGQGGTNALLWVFKRPRSG